MALSDNGLKLGIEALKTLVIVVGLLVPIMVQSSNQHAERVHIMREANKQAEDATRENNERLDRVAAEVKATARPLVFGGKE
jgi:hypothetical protein